LDRLDHLTDQLLDDLEREGPAHPFTASDAHLGECLLCLNRFVELRDVVHGMAAPQPVSRRLTRALDRLQGRPSPGTLLEGLRRVLVFRVPAWAVAGIAAALVLVTWVVTQPVPRAGLGVQWPLPDPTRPDPLRPAHGQGPRTVTGVVAGIRDATTNGVDAHVLSVKDSSGATYVLFTWGTPSVKPGDKVEIEALFTGGAQDGGPAVYQGVVTEVRRAK
jgi:hypothetical protein